MHRFIVLALLCLSVAAQAAPLSRTLASLGQADLIRLRGAEASTVIKLPKAPRETIGDLSLHLVVANSPSLIKSRSSLTIRLGSSVIATRTLDATDTSFVWDVRIPAALLKDGYNDLVLSAVQHYTYQCENEQGSELWTDIDALRSTLSAEVKGLRSNPVPRVTQLPLIFDDRLWQPRTVHFVFGNDAIAPNAVTAAAYVAQGIALFNKRRPYALTVHAAQSALATDGTSAGLPGLREALGTDGEVVMIGTRAELARFLSADITKLITGPFIGVLPIRKGEAFVTVVSGSNNDEMLKASRAFANADFKHSDAPFEQLENVPAQPIPFQIEAGETREFSSFGFGTQSRHGLDSTPFGVEFRVPGGMLGQKDLPMTLNLHFSYSASMRRGSALNVMVNGNFVNAIPMSDVQGAEFRNFKLDIPGSVLQPGMNVLSIAPIMTGEQADCNMFRPEYLVTTLFGDSSLTLPSRSGTPLLPDLNRFVRTSWPDSDRLAFHLLQNDTETIAGALSFFAGMAAYQQRIAPVQALPEVPSIGNVTLFGAEKLMPEFNAMPQLNEKYSWQATGNDVGLMQFVQDKRVITAVVAQEPGMLHRGLQKLNDRGLWPAISGSASIIDVSSESLRSEPATHQQTIEAHGNWFRIFSSWRNLTFGALILAGIFAAIVLFTVRRLARNRLGR